MSSKAGEVFGREPVLVLAALTAAINVAVGFGLPVTPEQVSLVNVFLAAVAGVIARTQVTPA